MAFLGKEYKFVSQENFEEYVKAVGIPEADARKYIEYKPSLKLEKNGDSYTFYAFSPNFNRELTFKSGETVDENSEKYTSKTTFTVDGNNVTKVQTFPNGPVVTTKKEYTGDSMVEIYTAAGWSGSAKRFYKA